MDPELLVDLEAGLAAIAHVMIDKPEDVQGIEESVVIVDELKRPIQEERGLHPVWVVRH